MTQVPLFWLDRSRELPRICFTCGGEADASFWVPNARVNYVTDLPSCDRCRRWRRWATTRGARGSHWTEGVAAMGAFIILGSLLRPSTPPGFIAVLLGSFMSAGLADHLVGQLRRGPHIKAIEPTRVGIVAMSPKAIERIRKPSSPG